METNQVLDQYALEAQRDETVLNRLVKESKGMILRSASKV